MTPRVRLAALGMIPLLALAACGPPPGPTVTVFAAASLERPFTELGRAFEAAHPGVRVRFSFEGSAALVDQLAQGAPADLIAAADEATMARATAAGVTAGHPRRFASNVLTLIVPAGNPARITGMDASLDGHKLVVCAPQVPCGAATVRLANQLGVTLRAASEETRVTDVRAKVASGQADAGVAYRTEATAGLMAIPIPGAGQLPNLYLLAAVAGAREPGLAGAFADLVTSAPGRAALTAAGFGP